MANIEKFREINEPRVEKIVGMMKTIMKSAKSNKASVSDVRDLFVPVTTRLSKLGPAPAPVPEDFDPGEPGPPMVVRETKPTLDPGLHSTRDMLEAMDVHQLTDLLTMTATQIDLKVNS